MIAGSPHPVTGRPERVRAAAIRRATLAVVAAILVGAGPVAAAMAAPGIPEPGKDRPSGPTIVPVRGRQLAVDDQGRYWMSGNLIGRWTVLTAGTLPGYAIPEAPWTVVQTGQERFDGCIDQDHTKHCDSGDPLGALNFDYLMWIPRLRRRSWRADHARHPGRSWRGGPHQVPGQDRAGRRPERAAGAAER
jgi:hypothetical protein